MSASLLRTLADASVRSLVLAGLVAALLALGRVRAPHVRHALWTAVMVTMLSMPIVVRLMPRIDVPMPAVIARTGWLALDARLTPVADASVDAALSGLRGSAPQPAIPASAPPASQGASLLPGARAAATPPARHGLPVVPALPTLAVLLATLYIGGASTCAAQAIAGWRRARAIVTTAVPVRVAVDDAARERVLESTLVTSPTTIGVFSAAIVVPPSWRTWTPEKTVAVLAHERAHVSRRDPLVRLVARINACVFWFHPLAWWLEARLAADAEYAADAIAAASSAGPRCYAEILVDVARDASRQKRAFAWQMIGIGGPGLIEKRIDHLLAHRHHVTSPRQPWMIGAAATAVVIAVVACRPAASASRFSTDPAIEARDRALRLTLNDIWRTNVAYDQTPFDVADEAIGTKIAQGWQHLTQDPDDLNAVRDLLNAYWIQPDRLARRHLILDLIERHPEAPLAGAPVTRLFTIDRDAGLQGDPEGYAQARQLWLAATDRSNRSSAVLGNASYFFEAEERARAEALLIRAQALDPGGPWTTRLARLYAMTLTGQNVAVGRAHGRRIIDAEISGPFGTTARQKLGESRDPVLLTAAGWFLARGQHPSFSGADPDRWAEACFERALQIEPHGVLAHAELLSVRTNRATGVPLWSVPPTQQYQAVSELPDMERFERLPHLADDALSTLLAIDRFDDQNLRDRRDIATHDAERFAQDALRLASAFASDARSGTAIYFGNMTLADLAMRKGDAKAAASYLSRASRAPASEELAYSESVITRPQRRLLRQLLEHGDRDALIAFYERMADTNIVRRAELRETAAALRRGESPTL